MILYMAVRFMPSLSSPGCGHTTLLMAYGLAGEVRLSAADRGGSASG